MTDDFFGVCHVKNNAFAMSRPPLALYALPADIEGDFVEPVRPHDCCFIVRGPTHHAKANPRRCGLRVKAPRSKGAPTNLCCEKHKNHEARAKAWRDGKVGT